MENTIENNNILIAEFDGGKIKERPSGRYVEFEKDSFWSEQLDYHKNWNSLMPVVEKIEKMGCIVEITLCLSTNCKIIKGSFKKAVETIANTENVCLKKAIYEAVVLYIHWHNRNKNQPV